MQTLKPVTEFGTRLPLGSTPLHLAAMHADADTIRTLVDCGAPLEEEDDYGWTALVRASQAGIPGNVVALIELGANWLHMRGFDFARMASDPKSAEVLVNKISTSTAEEQDHAASIVHEMMQDKSRNKLARNNVLDDWVKDWGLRWGVFISRN